MFMLAAALVLAGSPVAIAPCRPGDLVGTLDARGGDFNGMSHGGTRLTIRSRASAPCLVAGLPTLAFRDASGSVLPIARKAPPGMHPGPVVIPVRLVPGATAHADIRWVSGDVYEGGRCFRPTELVVTMVGKATAMPFTGMICGEQGKPAGFEQPPLVSDARPAG